jgi:hypothetical protein
MSAITQVKIHPAIGIARLGNSPTDFFIGPEIPLDHTAPAGGYKDASCRVKRQAARFRLFGYDNNGNLVQELTAAMPISPGPSSSATRKLRRRRGTEV